MARPRTNAVVNSIRLGRFRYSPVNRILIPFELAIGRRGVHHRAGHTGRTTSRVPRVVRRGLQPRRMGEIRGVCGKMRRLHAPMRVVHRTRVRIHAPVMWQFIVVLQQNTGASKQAGTV